MRQEPTPHQDHATYVRWLHLTQRLRRGSYAPKTPQLRGTVPVYASMLSVTCPPVDTGVSATGTGTHDPTLYLSVGPGAPRGVTVRVRTDVMFCIQP